MWIFGYGSLMWDGWEHEHACIQRVRATLPRFRRVFDKASVRNWGTRKYPCPTLNIADDPGGECNGLAFEFADDNRESIRAALAAREGRNFELVEHEIVLAGGRRVGAFIPRYVGKNLIRDKSLAERAGLVRAAAGTDGRCENYVQGIADKLAEMGIVDPAVQELSEAVRHQG